MEFPVGGELEMAQLFIAENDGQINQVDVRVRNDGAGAGAVLGITSAREVDGEWFPDDYDQIQERLAPSDVSDDAHWAEFELADRWVGFRRGDRFSIHLHSVNGEVGDYVLLGDGDGYGGQSCSRDLPDSWVCTDEDFGFRVWVDDFE